MSVLALTDAREHLDSSHPSLVECSALRRFA
jgi:hypothetical protein